MVNLLALLISFILYFSILPAFQNIIDTTTTALQLTPNPYTTITIAIIEMVPFFVILMLVLTGFNYAIPRPAGARQ